MKLRNKVVFITDADSLSGKVLINRLSGEGAHLILNSPSGGKIIETAVGNAAGIKTMVLNIDLCSKSALAFALEQAREQIGTVDVLIHNNNAVKPIQVEHGDEALFLEILNANAKTAYFSTQVIGRQMIEKQSGKVIYVNSIHAEKPTGSSFAYSASKGAIKMLAREAALYLGRHGVTVNAIEMGPVEGDDEVFHSDISTLYQSYQYKIPNAEVGTYDDLANLVLYLCTDEAKYMNGSDIRLDGGFVLHYMDHKMKKSHDGQGGAQ